MTLATRIGCLASIPLLLLAPAVFADDSELTPEKVGKIQHDEQQAVDKVQQEYGNRKSSEMTQSERREMIQKQQEELKKVHDAAGVDEKDFARYTARMSPDDRASAKAAEKAAAKESLKKEIKAEDEKAKGPQVVPYDATMQEQTKGAVPSKTPAPVAKESARTKESTHKSHSHSHRVTRRD